MHCTFVILDFPLYLQAFLIAFTSEFLPRLLYQYQYSWSLEGYVNFTLAYSPNGTLSEECRYVTMLHLHHDASFYVNIALKCLLRWVLSVKSVVQ